MTDSKWTCHCDCCSEIRKEERRPPLRNLRSMRFGSRALDEMRLEWQVLAATVLAEGLSGKPQPPWRALLPPIESDPVGYERQVLSDLQLGLMALEGPVKTQEEAWGLS